MIKYILFVLLVFFFSCSVKNAEKKKDLTVFAAASLADVVSELAKDFETTHSVKVKLSFAASGTLARQIEQGAEADIYLSANSSWTDYLIELNKSLTVSILASNELVLVSSIQNKLGQFNMKSFLNASNDRVVVGDPGFVPVGKYAMQIFDSFGVEMNDRLVYGIDARATLMMVELGEIQYAIVYKTDALRSQKVKIIHTFTSQTHDPVLYHAMLVAKNELSNQFYEYLYSDIASEILQKYSFKIN